jgi:hypothetical protein
MAIVRNDEILLVHPLNGKEYRRYKTGEESVSALAFSKDGKLLATGCEDTTALVWDLVDLPPPLPRVPLSQKQLAAAWTDLVGDDAEAAYRAVCQLSQGADETVAFLSQHLKPVGQESEKRIRTLLTQLDSGRFFEREQASRELLKLGEAVEAALADLAKKPPSLETGRRAGDLLKSIRAKRTKGPWTLTGQPLREARAIELLERIGSAEAKVLLERLATGSAFAPLTRQARAAADRLGTRAKQ